MVRSSKSSLKSKRSCKSNQFGRQPSMSNSSEDRQSSPQYKSHNFRDIDAEVKQTVFKTRDANSAINIMNLTKCWIDKQERPACFQISSFTTSNTKKEVEKVRPS